MLLQYLTEKTNQQKLQRHRGEFNLASYKCPKIGRIRFQFQPLSRAAHWWQRGSGLYSIPLLLTLDLLGMTVIQWRSSEQEALSSSPTGVVSLRVLQVPRRSSETETHYTGTFIPANSLQFIEDTFERTATTSVKLVTYSVTSHRWQLFLYPIVGLSSYHHNLCGALLITRNRRRARL